MGMDSNRSTGIFTPVTPITHRAE